MDKNDFNSLKDMEKDIIVHPENDLSYLDSILKSDLFTQSEIADINSALKIILNNEKLSETEKINLLDNSWKINHKFKPPTPEEFLTEKWIGPMAKDVFPHCKEVFLKYFNPKINKNKLISYACTGYGKSTLLAMIKVYRATINESYRNPKQYLHLGEITRLTDATICFTKSSAFSLVLNLVLNLLNTSPMYKRLKYERDMLNQEYIESGKILFCNTTEGDSVFRIGNTYMDCVSDVQPLVGKNLTCVSCTEMSFLSEFMPEERVMKLLNEMISRVQNRFGYNNPNVSIIIDTSPNSLETQVDQWIIKHKDDKDVLFVNTNKWSLPTFDWMFPLYNKDRENNVFPIFKGTSTQPTKIITKDEVKNYNNDDILWTPIDIFELAKDNVAKTMRDFGATPTAGSDTKLFTNHQLIEKCFVPNLKNFYMFEYASYRLPPEELLWDKIRPLFYVYTGKGNQFRLKRFPMAERFIHIDMAEKKDMAGISMIHLEVDKAGRKIYVADFTLPIMSKKDDKINLDSFKYLVYCIKNYGNTNIKKVTYDGFESKSSIQFLEREGFECERLSLDSSPDYYLSFASWVMQGRVKIGKNLIMKNNMKSLITTNNGHNGKESKSGKLIVDHVQGEWIDLENSDWENSKCGYFGKDLSDSFVGACTNADKSKVNYTQYLYDENEELEESTENDEKYIEKQLLERFDLKFLN